MPRRRISQHGMIGRTESTHLRRNVCPWYVMEPVTAAANVPIKACGAHEW